MTQTTDLIKASKLKATQLANALQGFKENVRSMLKHAGTPNWQQAVVQDVYSGYIPDEYDGHFMLLCAQVLSETEGNVASQHFDAALALLRGRLTRPSYRVLFEYAASNLARQGAVQTAYEGVVTGRIKANTSILNYFFEAYQKECFDVLDKLACAIWEQAEMEAHR